MTKPKLIVAIVFSTALLSSDPSSAGSILAEDVNLRSGPGLENAVVTKLQKSEAVKVVERRGDWLLTQTEDNHVGWVQTSVVKLSPDEEKIGESPATQTKEDSKPLVISELPKIEPTPSPPPAEIKPKTPESAPHQARNTLTKSPYQGEFKELTLAIRPGLAHAVKHPAGMETDGLFVGGHVAYYLNRYFALHVPYSYTRYGSNLDFHSLGGGPLIRFLDWGPVRMSGDGNALWVRGLGRNHFGWSAGGDLTFGFRKATLIPFIGPFARYERVYISGQDVGTFSYGLSINLTSFADLD